MATKPSKVFLDSNYLIGLYSSKDSLHERCIQITKKISNADLQLIASNYTISETITILSQRAGKKIAIQVGKYLLEENEINIIQQTADHDQKTWQVFKTIRNKNLSFVDASIIATMEQEGIRNLITFDKHTQSIARKKRLKVLA